MLSQKHKKTDNLQQIASDPNNSVWVFASAGSGKTTILTNRVLRLLLEGVAPNKILCLTFTKVAASEMQARINKELASWVLCNDEELTQKLENLTGKNPQKPLIQKARILFHKIIDEEFKIKIQTIHGFCHNLIKIFPFEAKINPNFELIEEAQEKLILKQAQKLTLNQALSNQDLRRLIEKISSKIDDESLIKLSQKLLDKKEKISALKAEFFTIANIEKEYFRKFDLEFDITQEKLLADFLQNLNRVNLDKLVLGLENSDSSRNKESLERIKKFLNKSNLENFKEYVLAFFNQEKGPRKFYKNIEESFAEIIARQRELITEFADKFNSLTICNDSLLLLKFVDQILENYHKIKKSNSFLDYNDLIEETNNLLANSDFCDWIKLKMDGSFDHILVDESQDTNHQQWNIIKALTEDFFSGLSSSKQKRSIFIVGDEKQSIYSFQGAEPHISEEIFAYFQNKFGEGLKKIELNNSYRSLKTILKAVDQIFSNPNYGSAISKINQFKSHVVTRKGVGKVEIWPQILNEKKEKDNSYEWKINFEQKNHISAAEKLAKITALKIADLVKNNGVSYSEIMVLLRNKTNEFNHKLIKFLHQYHIPFTTKKNIEFSDNLLLQDLVSVAKFALLPNDDLNLVALLKSPIFSISEQDLLEICLAKNSNNNSIYFTLAQLDKFRFINNELNEFLQKSKESDIYEFFDFIINKKNKREKLIGYFGVESLEILDKFLLLIFDFRENYHQNLQQFLSFIEKTDLGISLNGDEENSVKLSTIHGSKGLEAPIVFIPDCAYSFNRLPTAKENIFYLDNFPLWRAKKDQENYIVKAIRLLKLSEAQEEYLRLLYVAMTRAKNELYIGGYGDSKDENSWYEIIKNSLPEFLVEFPEFEEFSFEKKIWQDTAITLLGPRLSGDDKAVDHQSSVGEDPGNITISQQFNHSQIRGKLIHKILEILGKNHAQEKSWLKTITQNLINQDNFLDKKEKTDISAQINSLLDSQLFSEIFFDEIKCETEIIFENSLLRLDLIRISEKEALVIDYKSDESLPENIPEEYKMQILYYKKALEHIYPNKKITAAILWTKFLELSWL